MPVINFEGGSLILNIKIMDVLFWAFIFLPLFIPFSVKFQTKNLNSLLKHSLTKFAVKN